MVHEKFVKVGEKGQITIPKQVREDWHIKKGDSAKVVVMPSGMITIKFLREKSPEDRLLEVIEKAPKIDFKKAWKQVERERDRER